MCVICTTRKSLKKGPRSHDPWFQDPDAHRATLYRGDTWNVGLEFLECGHACLHRIHEKCCACFYPSRHVGDCMICAARTRKTP